MFQVILKNGLELWGYKVQKALGKIYVWTMLENGYSQMTPFYEREVLYVEGEG